MPQKHNSSRGREGLKPPGDGSSPATWQGRGLAFSRSCSIRLFVEGFSSEVSDVAAAPNSAAWRADVCQLSNRSRSEDRSYPASAARTSSTVPATPSESSVGAVCDSPHVPSADSQIPEVKTR